jgi:hypothetical protein
MKLMSVAAFAAVGVALSGCASIVEGTTQSVAVTTPPVDGARCTLTNSEGTWYLTTPGNATVHKTKNALNVACSKSGYQDASTVISPHFNGATAGNILAGGVIGIGIDAATGANFNYPETISVAMTPVAAPVPTAANPPPAPTTTTGATKPVS